MQKSILPPDWRTIGGKKRHVIRKGDFRTHPVSFSLIPDPFTPALLILPLFYNRHLCASFSSQPRIRAVLLMSFTFVVVRGRGWRRFVFFLWRWRQIDKLSLWRAATPTASVTIHFRYRPVSITLLWFSPMHLRTLLFALSISHLAFPSLFNPLPIPETLAPDALVLIQFVRTVA